MQDALYEFLILNKKISLPGIGTICLAQRSAQHDFAGKQFMAPAFSFFIDSGNDKPSGKLFEWLSSSLGITEWDAIKSVNDFSFSVKQRIADDGEMNWKNVGIIKRDLAGKFILDSKALLPTEAPVIAEKVIREKAEHTVRVGESEKTNVEMEEYFAETSKGKDYTWVIAIVITVLALMFIGWYFSEKGLLPSSAGNQTFIKSN